MNARDGIIEIIQKLNIKVYILNLILKMINKSLSHRMIHKIIITFT